MERIHTLIDKLSQQKVQGAPPANLLFTVQLLHQELLKVQANSKAVGTPKVAVTLPFSVSFPETVIDVPFQQPAVANEPLAEKEFYVLDIAAEEEPEAEAPAPYEAPIIETPKEYNLRKPSIQELFAEEPKPVAKEEPRNVYTAQQLFNSAFDSVTEVPTLAQYKATAEVHERIAEKKESLNDRLKQEHTEVAHLLKESPIKDLRKAIGINDRFAFVRELFRGDEAAYERSIKTINNFNIYSEAEYWITRELKHKQGWDDNAETTQHFYQLVRRRFS